MVGRDERRQPTKDEKGAGGRRRRFVVRFCIHVVEDAKNPQLIIADFVLESHIPAPALLLRIRARIEVEVKSGEYAKHCPDGARSVKVIGYWNQSVSIIRRRPKDPQPA